MVAQQKLQENGMHNALPSYLPNLQCFRRVGLVIFGCLLSLRASCLFGNNFLGDKGSVNDEMFDFFK